MYHPATDGPPPGYESWLDSQCKYLKSLDTEHLQAVLAWQKHWLDLETYRGEWGEQASPKIVEMIEEILKARGETIG